MSIWILAVLLMAVVAGMGCRQGAIRAAFSFVGLLLGALLARPFAHLIEPLLPMVGLKNPVYIRLLPPCIAFLAVLGVLKVIGLVVHKKVEFRYKYWAEQLRLPLWERLNHRLGLSLGLLNGAAYFILASLGIYLLSYWTFQLATPGADPRTIRIVNRLGKDLETTDMVQVACAIDSAPTAYYGLADVVGLIYHNPLLQARLSSYPAFLGLAERPEIQDIANDMHFAELQMRQAPILELVNYPKMQAILKNPELLEAILGALVPNSSDLTNYLATGKSPKFDPEQILGRWNFDAAASVALLRKTKPNINSSDMQKWKKWMGANYATASAIATPAHKVFLKGFPQTKPSAEKHTMQGQWKSAGDKYTFTLNAEGGVQDLTAEVQNGRLLLPGPGIELVFSREY